MGWSLPVPAIERLTLRRIPRYEVADEFAADGAQQLVLVDAGPPRVYRARTEGGFVRYTWHHDETGAEGYWTAEYPDGRDADLSGEEAYARYAVAMKRLVEKAGGRFVFGARVNGLLLGEVESLWDQVGIVEYPSAQALIEIASTPEFQEIEVHREAGLAGQLNLTTTESAFGAGA